MAKADLTSGRPPGMLLCHPALCSVSLLGMEPVCAQSGQGEQEGTRWGTVLVGWGLVAAPGMGMVLRWGAGESKGKKCPVHPASGHELPAPVSSGSILEVQALGVPQLKDSFHQKHTFFSFFFLPVSCMAQN